MFCPLMKKNKKNIIFNESIQKVAAQNFLVFSLRLITVYICAQVYWCLKECAFRKVVLVWVYVHRHTCQLSRFSNLWAFATPHPPPPCKVSSWTCDCFPVYHCSTHWMPAFVPILFAACAVEVQITSLQFFLSGAVPDVNIVPVNISYEKVNG